MWSILLLPAALSALAGLTQGHFSLLDCNFDNETICNYTVQKANAPGLFDVMEWRWGEPIEKQEFYDLKLLAFGPNADHTTDSPTGGMMYALRPINPNTNTTLVSPPARGRLCYVEFFYHMGSSSLNTMTAYIIKYGEKFNLWSVKGFQSQNWKRALVDIEKYTEFGDYQIGIEVTEPNDAYWTVGYALDDIKGIECDLPIDCDFETDMCNLEVQYNTSIFDPMLWKIGKSRTKTWFGVVDTMRYGPKGDHTTGRKQGSFAYALKTLASKTATGLLSPKQLDPLCHVSFWYYMNVSSLRAMEFHVRRDGSDSLVWKASGDQGAHWNYVQLSIENKTAGGSFEVVWWAKEPNDQFWTVGYALDDIKTYKCECDSNPCRNGGFCFNEFQNYTCHCPRYWAGRQCEMNTNPCRNSPCKNLASCTPVQDNYTCACWPGWTGHDCDVDIDDCVGSPCTRGKCVDHLNSFSCDCPAGYEGKLCDREIDECESTPCQNGANCTDGLDSFTCDCPAGFTGTQCETNIDECAPVPCKHGGTCIDEIDKFVCVCKPDFAGLQCELRVLMDCDFETDFCGYHVSTTDPTNSTDNFEWVHGEVATPSAFFGNTRVLYLGPIVDHTTGTSNGNAALAKRSKEANVTTTMLSPLMEGRLCYMEFFYHMGSSYLKSLNVYLIKAGAKNLIFSSQGYQGFEWQRAMVDIEPYTETGRYQLSFEVEEPSSGGFKDPGYAIDDIKGFNCDLSLDCDFENGTCNYIIEREDNYFDRMEWRRGQAVLETIFTDIKLLRNGPSADHTDGDPKGHFMYAVKPIHPGTNTTLVAPRQRDQLCFLQFYYHMGSTSLNDLIVYVRAENETYQVFNVSGYQSSKWNKALVNIEKETMVGKYEIAIYVDEPSDQVWTVGYAVDDISASTCLCANNPCLNGGQCTNLYKDYTCTCPYLFSGRHCETSLQPCDYDPCTNGGNCTNLVKKHYRCTCAPGWEGKNCDVEIDECQSQPCMNGATCTDQLNGFSCNCAPGWFGSDCSQNINECISNPCGNGATCKDEVNFFECLCAPGYFGVYCQFDIDECASSPCRNGGTCVDDINFYSCRCPPGYTGTDCEIDIDECVSQPCQNKALCMDRIARYDCYCRPGFTGITCGINVNECWSSPCQNNATCVDKVNDFSCSCGTGYTGSRCETDIDECASSPCRNGGTCRDLVGRYHCDCPIHWTGDQCQKSLTACGLDPC